MDKYDTQCVIAAAVRNAASSLHEKTPEGCPVPVTSMSWMKDVGAVLRWMDPPNAAASGFRLTEPTFHPDWP